MIFSDSVHGPVLLSDPSHPREAPQGSTVERWSKKALKNIYLEDRRPKRLTKKGQDLENFKKRDEMKKQKKEKSRKKIKGRGQHVCSRDALPEDEEKSGQVPP
jgi:hypothetical protein